MAAFEGRMRYRNACAAREVKRRIRWVPEPAVRAMHAEVIMSTGEKRAYGMSPSHQPSRARGTDVAKPLLPYSIRRCVQRDRQNHPSSTATKVA
jgi:hypothetical protein